MSKLDNKLELRVNKGKLGFVYVDKGEDNYYSQFGYLKGEAKWAKILAPDQYGNYAVDVYPSAEDLEHIKAISTEMAETAKALVEEAGKKVNGIADVCKEYEGTEYIQFKRKAEKANGDTVAPPKIYDAGGTHVADWDKLVGNGSTVKIKYRVAPYYMASTKMVGLSYNFYAVQVIDLKEFSGGDSGFGDETDGQAPFDVNGEEF